MDKLHKILWTFTNGEKIWVPLALIKIACLPLMCHFYETYETSNDHYANLVPGLIGSDSDRILQWFIPNASSNYLARILTDDVGYDLRDLMSHYLTIDSFCLSDRPQCALK